MENQPKVITEEELYDEFEKLDIKTRFAVEFSGYRLSAVFIVTGKQIGRASCRERVLRLV